MQASRIRTLGGALFAFMILGALTAPIALAQQDVCPAPKWDVTTQSWEGTAPAGITSISGSDEVVTIVIADGYTLTGLCVKTGSGPDAAISPSLPVEGPATVTVSKTGEGGGVSHVGPSVSLTPDPDPEFFDICHQNEDGSYDLLEGLTQAELDAHAEHAGDEAPVEGACPEEEDEEEEEEEDDVLGERIDKPSKPGEEVLGERQSRGAPRVAGKALPFTGIDPTPFLALAGLLAASGASALVISRNKR